MSKFFDKIKLGTLAPKKEEIVLNPLDNALHYLNNGKEHTINGLVELNFNCEFSDLEDKDFEQALEALGITEEWLYSLLANGVTSIKLKGTDNTTRIMTVTGEYSSSSWVRVNMSDLYWDDDLHTIAYYGLEFNFNKYSKTFRYSSY